MKAKITRPDGTQIEAEGTAEELRTLIAAPPVYVPNIPFIPAVPQIGDSQEGWFKLTGQGSITYTGGLPVCNCPLSDPNFKGGPIFWGGICPVHTPSYGTLGYSQNSQDCNGTAADFHTVITTTGSGLI